MTNERGPLQPGNKHAAAVLVSLVERTNKGRIAADSCQSALCLASNLPLDLHSNKPKFGHENCLNLHKNKLAFTETKSASFNTISFFVVVY